MNSETCTEHATVVDALFEQAAIHPDKIIFSEFVADKSRDLTYTQLIDEIVQCSASLQAQGIGRGCKVLILASPNVQMAITLLALFRLGAVPIIIDPAVGLATVLKSIVRVRPDAIICKPLIKIFLPLFGKTLSTVTTVITTSQLINSPILAKKKITNKPTADDLAAIFFTSGSTDLPKPVEWTHRQLKAHVDSVPLMFELNEDDVDLALFPLSMLISPVLGISCKVPDYRKINPKSCDVNYLFTLIQQVEATVCFASPIIWSRLSRYCLANNKTLPSIKNAVSGGAPISAKIAKRVQKILPNGRFFSPYGATEASPITYADAIEFKQNYGVKLGRPVKGLRLKIKNHAGINLAAHDHEVGEIMLAGDLVSKHYHLSPQLDAQAKVYDQELAVETCWHLTGDLAVVDEQGQLWSLGRLKDVVTAGDDCLFTTLAEEPINLLDEVENSALLALHEPHHKQVIYLVIEAANKLNKRQQQQLTRVVRDKLEEINYSVDRVCFIKKMLVDKRHHSKIDRKALKKWLMKGRGR